MSSLVKEVAFWSKAAIAAGIAAYALYYFSILDSLDSGDARSGASTLAQLSGTMLGFVLAALAILTTLENTPLVTNMRVTGHFSQLLRRMLGSVVAFGIVTVAGAALLFVPTVKSTYMYPLLGTAVFSALLLIDVCKKLWLVLENLNPAP